MNGHLVEGHVAESRLARREQDASVTVDVCLARLTRSIQRALGCICGRALRRLVDGVTVRSNKCGLRLVGWRRAAAGCVDVVEADDISAGDPSGWSGSSDWRLVAASLTLPRPQIPTGYVVP
jgi:hypothetical protein